MIFLSQIETTARKQSTAQLSAVYLYLSSSVAGRTIVSQYPSRLINGYFEFIGLESVVRAHMRQYGDSCITVSGYYKEVNTAGEESTTTFSSVQVIFTLASLRKASSLTADACAAYRFFTPSKVSWMAENQSMHLYYYTASSESYSVTYTLSDGSTREVSGSSGTGFGSVAVNPNAGEVKAEVVMGNRSHTVYYLPMEKYELIQFRNVFNAWENVCLPCSMEEALSSEYELAAVDGRDSRYDIENHLDLKIKTSPLPAFMYDTLFGLVHALTVQRYDPYRSGNTVYGVWSQVYVKDYKLPRSTNPNSGIVMEMTLAFSDRARNDAVVIS